MLPEVKADQTLFICPHLVVGGSRHRLLKQFVDPKGTAIGFRVTGRIATHFLAETTIIDPLPVELTACGIDFVTLTGRR